MSELIDVDRNTVDKKVLKIEPRLRDMIVLNSGRYGGYYYPVGKICHRCKTELLVGEPLKVCGSRKWKCLNCWKKELKYQAQLVQERLRLIEQFEADNPEFVRLALVRGMEEKHEDGKFCWNKTGGIHG